MKNIKVVAFDLGGVYFIGPMSAGFKDLLRQEYNINEKQMSEFMNVATNYSLGKIKKKEYLRKSKKVLNVSLKKMDLLNKKWIECYVENKKLKEIIKKLHRKYKIATVSGNMRDRIIYLNKKYDFVKNFDMKILSYNDGLEKTDNKIYKELIKKAKCSSNQILFIDNSQRHCNIAKSLGIKTILFKDNQRFYQKLKKI